VTFNGQEYKRKRKEAGMTQEDVYLKTGIAATHVSRYEIGKQKPLRSTQIRLEDAINEANTFNS